MVIVAGTVTLDPAKRKDAEAAFDRMRDATLKEPGCIEYQAYFDRKDPGRLLILEKWESPEALGAHFTQPHMAEFSGSLGQLGVTGTHIVKYDVTGETRLM